MKTIQVFDPALCCGTGVCGVEVDEALVSFSADVDWARGAGAQIDRFNLAQQPMAFAEHAAVKEALERSGQGALPLIVIDGKVAMSGRYPTRDELAQWLGLSPGTNETSAGAKLAAIAVVGAPASCCCGPSTATEGTSATSKEGASKCR